MSYADAINHAMDETIEHLRMYGRLLAQSGLTLLHYAQSISENEMKYVRQGYEEQLRDYPNG